MINSNDFLPDWVSPPGDTVADLLTEHKLSQADFAHKFGCKISYVEDLICGDAEISADTANTLSGIFGTPPSFWLRREAQYRADLVRLEISKAPTVDANWLRELPLRDMVKYGWLPAESNLQKKYSACLKFFDVPNVPAWRSTYQEVLGSAAFKTSATFEAQPGAGAWQISNPPVLSAAPLLASLELFQEARLERLRDKSVAMTSFLEQLLQPLQSSVELITPRAEESRGCQLSLRILGERSRGKRVLDRLTELGVICDWREPDVIRVAPIPLYNRFEDVFTFSERLAEILRAD